MYCSLRLSKQNQNFMYFYHLHTIFQIRSCVGTKYIGRWADLAVDISLDAVNTVTINDNGRIEVDIKK